MVQVEIDLGTKERASALFAYPNGTKLSWTLCQTIEHWVRQTIRRDAFEGKISVDAQQTPGQDNYVLQIYAKDDALQPTLNDYQTRLSEIYAAGWQAYTTVVPLLKKKGLWDPRHKDWRFFMPMGMSVVSSRCLMFFHYPPQKMLLELQDYLNDPVPYRLENLMMASNLGVSDRAFAQSYECIVDGCPIAAPDDAGSAKGGSTEWGLIPIEYFTQYQAAMVNALLRPHLAVKGYTYPIVVFGAHPRKIFSKDFLNGDKLLINQPTVREIRPGYLTPIIAAHHPYNFYWTSQVGSNTGPGSVGDGHMQMKNCVRASQMMFADLVSVYWMLKLSENPALDVQKVVDEADDYWSATAQQQSLCALTQSQATLFYTNAAKTLFKFRVDEQSAAKDCTAHGNQTCSFEV